MTPEEKVKFLRPSARLLWGHHGKVWVSSEDEDMLGDVAYLGTKENREVTAWLNALAELEG